MVLRGIHVQVIGKDEWTTFLGGSDIYDIALRSSVDGLSFSMTATSWKIEHARRLHGKFVEAEVFYDDRRYTCKGLFEFKDTHPGEYGPGCSVTPIERSILGDERPGVIGVFTGTSAKVDDTLDDFVEVYTFDQV